MFNTNMSDKHYIFQKEIISEHFCWVIFSIIERNFLHSSIIHIFKLNIFISVSMANKINVRFYKSLIVFNLM